MKSGLAVVLAFGALLLTPPAQANWQSNQVFIDRDTIQFSYVWGWAEREVQGEITVTVDNTITNTIGYVGETIDNYRIIFGGEVIEGAEKGLFTYTFTASESQVIRFEGIDNGFWGGYYGPIVTVTQAVQEIPLEPVTESATVSPEVTESATVSESTTVSESLEVSASEPIEPEPSAPEEPIAPPPVIESPSPEPQPVTESPEPELVVSESAPVQSTESPASESAISTTSPENLQTESPQPTPEQTPAPQPQATAEPIQPSPEPIPEVTNAPTQPAEEITQEPEETQSDSVSAAVETTPIEGLTEAVGAVINAFATAGLDMSPEKREEAQEVIVSSVIVSQVAATATAAVRKK